MTDDRAQRALALAKERGASIRAIVGTKYLCPSATHSGGYVVNVADGSCTCANFQQHGGAGRAYRCKHVLAVLYTRREIALPEGNPIVSEEKTKNHYARDWPATNRARTLGPRLGPPLLADLIDGLHLTPPPQPGLRKRGRPRVPERDLLLAASLRAYEDMTAGATVVAVENYRSLGVIKMDHVPSYNTLLRRFAEPQYMPVFHRMIAGSAAPLLALESKFAIDGTGFGSSPYDHYCTEARAGVATTEADPEAPLGGRQDRVRLHHTRHRCRPDHRAKRRRVSAHAGASQAYR